MVDTETGIPKFTSRPAGVMKKEQLNTNLQTEYYVYYQFTPNDTQKVARYKGKKEAINFNNKSRKMRTFGSRYVGRLNTEFFTNINMMTERMFGSQSIAQKFRNVSGLAGVINGN
jgi:hypothetical protein